MRGYDVVDLSTDMTLFTTTHRKHLHAPMCEAGAVSSPVAHGRKLTLREGMGPASQHSNPDMTNSKSHPLSPVRNHISARKQGGQWYKIAQTATRRATAVRRAGTGGQVVGLMPSWSPSCTPHPRVGSTASVVPQERQEHALGGVWVGAHSGGQFPKKLSPLTPQHPVSSPRKPCVSGMLSALLTD